MKEVRGKLNHYVRQLEPYILLSSAVFLIFAVMGYSASIIHEDMIRGILNSFLETFTPLLDLSPLRLMFTIFANNVIATLIAMMGGFLFGLGTLYILAVNGFLVGIVSFFILSQGSSATLLMAGLLPHGVIELPVIWVAGGVGLLVGRRMIEKVFLKKYFNMKKAMNELMVIFLLLLVPLFIAAAIEVYITPLVMGAVSSF